MMTKLCSGQGKRDDADADAAADQSNTYISPFQATQKCDYVNLNMQVCNTITLPTLVINGCKLNLQNNKTHP